MKTLHALHHNILHSLICYHNQPYQLSTLMCFQLEVFLHSGSKIICFCLWKRGSFLFFAFDEEAFSFTK